MLNFQEKIRELLQTELNKNTQGLNFEVSLYNMKTNSLLENTEQIGETYATEQKRFIPVLIEDISGDYVDLKDVNAVEASINMSLMIPTDSQDFNNIVIGETYQKVALAMDELRERLQATTLPLGSKLYTIAEDFNLSFNVSNFDPNLFETYVEFTDYSDGRIFYGETDNHTYEFKKINNLLQIFVDGIGQNSYSYNLEDKKRIIWSLDDGFFRLWLDSFSYSSPVFTNSDADLTWNSMEFGGAFMNVYSIEAGDVVDNNVNYTLEIKDFENFSLENGSQSWIDTSNALYASEKGELGRIVFGFSIPNPTTNQFTFGNGLNYQQFELALDAFITDQVFLGNEVKYYLDDVEIFPFFRDESFASETDASQVVGQQITKFTSTQTVIGREYSIYLKENKKLFDLAKKIVSETPEPNEVYKFKVTYPLFEKEYDVIISQGALGISNNSPISISFKVDLASNALLS